IYIDGALAASAAFGDLGDLTGPFDLLIGAFPSWVAPTDFFVGEMDEIEIFDRALTQGEIQAIYDAGSAGKCKTELCPLPPRPPLVQMPLARVQGGGAGPDYTFYMSIHEVTNEQYAVFLNDAERDGGASGLGAQMIFAADGSVTLNDGTILFRPQGVVGTASRIRHDVSAPVGERYAVEEGFEQHPITSVSWFGALKFCNWLTLDQGINCDQRSYTEGPAAGDWHPITISTADWAVRDLNNAERQALVDGYAGFRLPMDNLAPVEGWIGDQENSYNEWYKAMAYRPGAAGGVDSAGAAHPPNHAFFGFGRDDIDVASANYGALYSDDLPVGSFEVGTILEPGGTPTLTRPDNNYFGIADLSGNVAEWLQDHAGSPFSRAVRGGHFDGLPDELLSSHRIGAAAITADAGTIGFRVTQTVFEMPTIEGDLFDKLRHAFSQIGLDQVATGILLNTGSFIYGGSILEQNGSNAEAPPLDRDTFAGAYQDLVRSSVGADLPTYDALETAAEALRDDDLVAPIMLAIVDYTMVDPEAWSDARVVPEGEFYVQTSPPDPTVFHNRRFVGSSILPPRITDGPVTFLLPSAFLVNTTGEQIAEIAIRFAGDATEYAVEPGVPFDVPALQFDEEGVLEYSMTLSITVAPRAFGPAFTYTTKGTVAKGGCKGSCSRDCAKNICQCPLNHQCIPGCPGSCPSSICGPIPQEPPYIHLTNPIVAATPYGNGNGELYVRIYPSPNTPPPPWPSLSGRLRKVIVAVDGFDPTNCRTHGDIWCAFGDTIEVLRRDHDYDIVVPDYRDGRTYIQRNGLALRTLLKDHLPGWIDDDFKCRPIIMITGSMGGQVGRYALRTMELDGEAHNVGLFIAIDSPFQGAAIPIGLQEATKFLADLGQVGAQQFLAGLQSPAARQMLRFYNEDPLHDIYYNEVNSLGLPQKSRNVALANGTSINRVDKLPKGSVAKYADLNKTIYANICLIRNPFNGNCLHWYTIRLAAFALNVKSDHPGTVFHSWLSVLGITVGKQVGLTQAVYVDLARGGLRNSPRQFRDAWNDEAVFGPFDLSGMTGTQDYHNFIPLFSALGVEPPGGDALDLDWIPSCEPGGCTNGETPFDNAWFKPLDNTGHVCQTVDAMSVLLGEINDLESSLLGVGACCFLDGTCEVMDGQCCISGGGTPHGDGSLCQGDNDHNGVDDTCECVDPPPDMVAWWTGDNDLTLAVDTLGNHHGSFEGDVRASVVGPKVGGGALFFSDFPGGISYIEVPDASGLNIGTGGFTVDLWLRTTADGYRPIVEKGSGDHPGYALRLLSGKLYFVVCDIDTCSSVLSPVSPLLNNDIWHYVAATYSRGPIEDQIDIYIDGAWAASRLFDPLGSISNVDDLWIGAGPSGTSSPPTTFFNGEMDEIEIFNRALDPSEIEAIFLAGSAGKCKGVPLPDGVYSGFVVRSYDDKPLV
ncbi:MAG: SUMF1/EgtB/PvdO family nonheme iron enzyme, partial [Planctomycetes bacterium]|nr:SUMF1/EgtB/PvdO family nonheme iron enzyme [Planctomycetota bacterium]